MQSIPLTMVLVALAASGSAFAQPAAPSPDPNVGAPPHGAVYRSAFDDYRRHAAQPVTSWRDANNTVGRIGGWQAYAREAAGPTTTDASSKVPASKAAEPARKPEGPASTGGAHGGHGGGGAK